MKSRSIKTIALAALLILGCSSAFASGIGKITSLEGSVDLFRQGSASSTAAGVGSDIEVGDSVRTKSSSKAEITFADKSVVRLAEKTKLDISDYSIGGDGKRISAVLNVERGKVRAIISKSAGKDSFKINTPNANGSVKGTDVVVIFQKSSTAVAVLNGKYSLSNPAAPDKKVDVKGGEVSVVAADNAPSLPRVMLASEKRSHETDTSVSRSVIASSEGKGSVAEGYSQPGEMKAVVVKLAGTVRIKNKDSKTWHDAKANETVKTGDSIETKDNGKAEFKLDNGNVITLQQNSNVTISKLSQAGNGEYENLFESTGGKLRAQVEKLKGNSKFEVKTPNAVACVRGTVLFLNILPNLTNAYFEEGNGVLRSVISGTTQNVPMGTGSTADGNGNISNPLPPSDDQKSNWHEGWEIGGDVEGYSGPEGYSGGGTNNNENPDNGANNVFSDKPFTDIIGSGEGGTGGSGEDGEPGPLPITMNGTIEGSFGYDEGSENNFFNMALSSTTPLEQQWSGVMSMDATGTYSTPNNRVFTGNVSGAGVDGGAFYGWSGGIMHSWDTVVSSIYIDPSGLAGNLFGVLSGSATKNEFDGYFSGDMGGSGDLYFIPMAQLEPGIEYGTIEGWGYGNLSFAFDGGNGYFDTEFDRQMAKIDGQNWGIWREAHSGGYYNPNGLTSWNAVAGGDYNDGYFFSSVEGSDDLNGGVRLDISGSYLDKYTLGAYYGTILAHTGEGVEGIGGGGFIEQELSSSTELYNCAYAPGYEGGDYYGVYFDHAGHIGGLGGTVGDLWGDEGFYFVSIGQMEGDEDDALQNFVWMTDFEYDNQGSGDDRISGNEEPEGAYYGLSSVTGKDGAIKGSARIIYIDPNGYAGVRSGRLDGAYSSLAGAYMLGGDFTDDNNITPVVAGIGAADLLGSIWTEEGDGRLAGGYSGEGYINGYDDLYTASIVDYEHHTALDWGIYSQKLLGEYVIPADSDGVFSAKMGGNDVFGAYYYGYGEGEGDFYSDNGYWIADLNGQGGGWFNGSLNGLFITGTKMGTISGDLDGAYYNDGTWLGSGSGTWNGSRLTLSGYWGYENSSLYTDGGEGSVDWAGREYGYMGSTAEDWWDNKAFSARAIGEFEYDYYDGTPRFWDTEIESYNVEKDNYTTLDGGAYYGFTAGTWKDGLMSDGRLIAIFAAPDGRLGIMRGGASGEYYEDIGMWQALMGLSTEMVEGYSIAPEDLRDSINEDYIGYMYLGGSFAGNGTIGGNISTAYSYSIGEMPWGIFNIKMGGWFNKDDGNVPENGLALGNVESDYGEHLLITAKNVRFNGGSIAADVNGAFIDLEEGMIGTVSGDFRGNSTDHYYGELEQEYSYTSWAGAAIGAWKTEPLAYSGILTEGGFGNVEEDWGGFYPESGDLSGVFGGSGNIWEGPADFTLIGSSYNPDLNDDGYNGDCYLWASDFVIITDDNAVASGTVGGTSMENRLEGMLLSIYIRETDEGYRTGYIMSADETGNYDTFGGDFYPSLGMFGASGKLAYFLDLPTEYAPEVLLGGDEALDYNDIYGAIGGDIRGTLGGESLALVDQNWSLWRAASSGTFGDIPEDNWTAAMGDVEYDGDGLYSTYTLAFIDGTSWEDGEFSADISGKVLSNRELTAFTGKMLGVYGTEYNEWESLSLGVAQAEYLTLSGLSDGYIFYDEDGFVENGITNGNIGSTQQEWWAGGSFDVITMGEYEGDLDRSAYLIGSQINSFNGYDGTDTTDDGEGAFWGWTVGTARNGRLPNMYTAALFISPGEDGYQAGILRGSSDGLYCSMPTEYLGYDEDMDVGIWQAEGTWTPSVMMDYISMDPSSLIDNIAIEENIFRADGNGNINGNPLEAQIVQASAASLAAYDDWGIVRGTMLAQSDSVVTDGTWRTALGGVVADTGYGVSYLLLSANGTNSVPDIAYEGVREGDVNGSFRGISLSPEDWDSETGKYLTMNVGRVEGDMSGFYEAGVDTTIQTAFVGQWVDLAELTTDALGFDNEAIAAMVQIPITETYTGLLNQTGSMVANGTITNMAVDLSIYTDGLRELFTAYLGGNYTGSPDLGWQVNTGNGIYSATLSNGTWNPDGTWTANVDITGPNNNPYYGAAGGIYGNGSMEGVGAGIAGTRPE